jgi:hypothetical protein
LCNSGKELGAGKAEEWKMKRPGNEMAETKALSATVSTQIQNISTKKITSKLAISKLSSSRRE